MRRSKEDLSDLEDLKFLRRRLTKQLKEDVITDEITFPQLLNAMLCIGRIMQMERNLTKDDNDESEQLGITVRKYEKAFASANGNRGNPSRSRSIARPRLVSTDDDSELAGDFDTDA